MPALDEADSVLQESLERARKLLRDAPGDEVLAMLEDADMRLKRRLAGMAVMAPGLRFSDAQVMAYQRQIAITIEYVKKRLLGITDIKAKAAISKATKTTVNDIEQLNQKFTGIAVPLRLREAATMSGIVRRVNGSLVGQRATSVDRYGDGMTRQFRTIIRDGMIQGVSQGQMVDALVGHGGPRGPRVSTRAREDPITGKVIRLKEESIPEGLFVRKRYWAERVVRTEVAHGQNEARLRTIEESKRTDFPDMGKKILAMMDMRTAMDSIGVHGQVRPTDGLFQDGAGRQYLRPPARPNDRETIVPWRLSWEETPYSAPMPPQDVAKLQAGNEPPGLARQLKIRQATKGLRAEMSNQAKRVMRSVRRMVAGQLGGAVAVAAVSAQRVTSEKADEAQADAKTKVAEMKALEARQRRAIAAAAAAQKVVTKDAQARVRAAKSGRVRG